MHNLDHSWRGLARHAGFTLVEVAIAIGVFSFAVVALVGTMGILLDQSRQASESTYLVGAVGAAESAIRGAANRTQLQSVATNYLTREGTLLGPNGGANERVFYRAETEDISSATASPRHRILKLKLRYPAPNYPKTFETPVSWYGNTN